jgi:DNA-binding NarL/FixJ family response regulator
MGGKVTRSRDEGSLNVTIRLLLVDDQALVREGFRALLAVQQDMLVVGEACNGEEAVEAAKRLHPDVVLMDVRMPVMDGLEATRRLMASAESQLHVLILTTFDMDEYVYSALRAGASGFLLKDASAHELLAAIRIVAAGDALLAPSVTRRLIAEFARLAPRERLRPHGLLQLTERETEVLRLIARGMSNAEISTALVVAEQTVKSHVSRVLTKLGLRDRAQAVVVAYETGLTIPGDMPV